MSGWAEFKEETFEKYFGYELARLTNVTFSPDQCDEEFLGFDDAFFIQTRLLSRIMYTRRSRMLRRSGLSIDEFDGIAEAISRRMPSFKFNLFVQYKRPEYIDHHRGKEWACWKNPYFRFDITPHQQKILADLDAYAKGRAAVVYASAAFWKNSDLYSNSANGTVVANSNVASVAQLNGHERFSYQTSGSFGRGHSDPIEIEGRSIGQIIEDGLRQKEMPLIEHVKRVAGDIEEVVASDKQQYALFDQVRRIRLGEEADAIADRSRESFAYSLATVLAFSEVADLSFHAMG